MRLIDSDALKDMMLQAYNDALSEFDMPWKKKMAHSVTLSFMADIDEAPTVDAVPVVRCKDCEHRPTKPDDYNPITTDGFALEFPDEKCPCQCGDGWYSKYPDDDWYCPIGERKGGDE